MGKMLSTRELADAIGVSESTVRRWANQGRIRVTRTAGGHRRIHRSEAVRFIRESAAPVLKPQVLGLEALRRVEPATAASPPIDEPLYDALRHGDRELIDGLVLGRFMDGEPVADLLDGPIRKAMHRLGECWSENDEHIFLEHRATQMCLHVVGHLQALLPAPPADAPGAIGCAPGADVYALPTLMAAAVLTDAGWDATNLGPCTPWNVLALAAARARPALVWVSISALDREDPAAPRIDELARRLMGSGALLAIGGRESPAARPTEPHIVRRCASMAELAVLANGLHAAMAPDAAMVGHPGDRTVAGRVTS